MKQRYYAADAEHIIQIVTELGKNELQISVGNNKLDWHEIKLSNEKVKELLKFLKDNNVGEWK